MLSCFSHVQLFVTPWTIACQIPLSMGFSRQEYWSRLLWPLPGDLSNPGIEPSSPTMWETQVRSLGQEEPLEKEMVIHSSILVWEIPWTEETGGLKSKGPQRVRHNLETNQQTADTKSPGWGSGEKGGNLRVQVLAEWRGCEAGKQWAGDDGWCGHRAKDSSKTYFRNQKKASGTLRAIETKRTLTPPLYLNHEKNKEENPLTWERCPVLGESQISVWSVVELVENCLKIPGREGDCWSKSLIQRF